MSLAEALRSREPSRAKYKQFLDLIEYENHWQGVFKFHSVYGCRISEDFDFGDFDLFKLRYSLIEEEFGELEQASFRWDLVEVFDGVIDLIYVTIGSMISFGIKPEINNRMFFSALKHEDPQVDRIYDLRELVDDFSGCMKVYDSSCNYLTEMLYRIKLEESLKSILLNCYFFCVEQNLPIVEGFNEVQRSNMSKLGEDGMPIYRESDGKVLKGPNFTPPDLKRILIEKGLF